MARADSGIWEGFVAGVAKGARYKFHIKSPHDGFQVDKSDPFAIHNEQSPATASVVWDLEYEWGDGGWMAGRGANGSLSAPVAIYEMHVGSWMHSAGGKLPHLPGACAQAD